MARPTSTIAAYGFLVSCYFYWDARIEGFYLMEIAPGNLVQVQQTPIVFRRWQRPTCPLFFTPEHNHENYASF